MAVPIWSGKYIGLNFKEKGRSRTGLDCWGLVRLVLSEQFGVDVPSYAYCYESSTDKDGLGNLIRRESLNWRVVSRGQARAGDVVIMRMYGQPMHTGIVIEPGQMLHIERGINSVIEKYTNLRWSGRVIALYRHRDLVDI